MKCSFRKFLSGVLAATVVIATMLCFTGCGIEHIEDTNGADNYGLTTITDQQIIDRSFGALNVKTSTGFIDNMVTVSSDKFTGVYEVLYTNYIGKSDFTLDIYGFEVTSGNFKMCVVLNDKIVDVIEPQDFNQYLLEDVSGTLRLVIAGESAAFRFKLTEAEYNSFAHDVAE